MVLHETAESICKNVVLVKHMYTFLDKHSPEAVEYQGVKN